MEVSRLGFLKGLASAFGAPLCENKKLDSIVL